MKSFRSTGRVLILVGILMDTCSSCKKGGVTQSTSQSAYEQWKSHNLHDYTINQKLTCYCVYGGQSMQVTVRADTVAAVMRVTDSSAVANSACLSVDSLFAIVQHPGGDSLVVRYNADYGYPEYLDINPQLHPLDGGVLYETSDLHIP